MNTDYSKFDTTVKVRWGRVALVWVALVGLFWGITQFVGCAPAEAAVNMDAIKQIESGGNARAYNKGSGARGLYQITPICLKHYNQVHGTAYKVEELYKEAFNYQVASWYFGWLKQTYGFDDVEAIIGFNAGPRRALNYRAGLVDLPEETVGYLTKYQALTAV